MTRNHALKYEICFSVINIVADTRQPCRAAFHVHILCCISGRERPVSTLVVESCPQYINLETETSCVPSTMTRLSLPTCDCLKRSELDRILEQLRSHLSDPNEDHDNVFRTPAKSPGHADGRSNL